MEYEEQAALKRYINEADVGLRFARAYSPAYSNQHSVPMESTRDVSALDERYLGAVLENGEADRNLTDIFATTYK